MYRYVCVYLTCVCWWGIAVPLPVSGGRHMCVCVCVYTHRLTAARGTYWPRRRGAAATCLCAVHHHLWSYAHARGQAHSNSPNTPPPPPPLPPRASRSLTVNYLKTSDTHKSKLHTTHSECVSSLCATTSCYHGPDGDGWRQSCGDDDDDDGGDASRSLGWVQAARRCDTLRARTVFRNERFLLHVCAQFYCPSTTTSILH